MQNLATSPVSCVRRQGERERTLYALYLRAGPDVVGKHATV